MRGFLLGIIWGALMGAIVLGAASYLGGPGPVIPPRPETQGTLLPGEADGEGAARVTATEDPSPARVEAPVETVAEPAPDTVPEPPEVEPQTTVETLAPAPDAPAAEEAEPAPAIETEEDAALSIEAPAAPEAPMVADAAPTAPEMTEAPRTSDEELSPEAQIFAELLQQVPDDAEIADELAEIREQNFAAQTGAASDDGEDATTDGQNADPNAIPMENVEVIPLETSGDENEAEAAPADAAAAEDDTALRRFAAAYDADGFPLVSVLFIDRGDLEDPAAALGELPFSTTVLVDPERADARSAMRAYRDAGVEVGVLLDMSGGIAPSDAAVIIEGSLMALPESVILLTEGELGGVGQEGVADAVMQALAERGMGYVALQRGISGAVRSAERAGVPALQVERPLLDGDGTSLKQGLDWAGFAARQGRETVLVSELTWDAISALRIWGQQARLKQVSLAPVSAILAPEAPEAEATEAEGEEAAQ